jgi:hypothetical protein
LLYAAGDFAGLERHARGRGEDGKTELFQALVEKGSLAEAEKVFPTSDTSQLDPYHCLVLSLAWHLAKDTARANAWRERATAAFNLGDTDDTLAAGLLRRATPPTSAELNELIVHPRGKSILLAMLAVLHSNPAFAASARQFNLDHGFPHHLVERAAATVP